MRDELVLAEPRPSGYDYGPVRRLPAKWDGLDVEWGGWELIYTSLDLCGPPERCTQCGAREKAAMNRGRLAARRVRTLVAFRCPVCRVDMVFDYEVQAWWVLDESDYGAEGSTYGE